jgi:hypothetical protein
MNRALDVGAVIRRVLRIYVEEAPVLMPVAAAVFAVTGILAALLLAASPTLGLVGVIVSLVAIVVFTGMVVELVSDVREGRRDSSPRQLLRAVAPVVGQLLLVGLVAGVCIVAGLVLFVVPGLILITVWSVAAPVIVLEHPAGLRALGRSRELVRGSAWRVFGVILVLDILVVVVGYGLQLAADSAGAGAGIVVRVVIGVLTAPLSALASAVMYFELRRAATVALLADAGPSDGAEPPS